MELAASAAELGLWVWEIESDAIWATDKTRALLGFGEDEPLDFRSLRAKRFTRRTATLCRRPWQSRSRTVATIRSEYRIARNGGTLRWISARGRVEFDASGRPVRMRGVSIDVTERKQAEVELRQNREELAHVGRVALMGELAASLAHELNQPLTGIVTNAQVGQRFIGPRKVGFRGVPRDFAGYRRRRKTCRRNHSQHAQHGQEGRTSVGTS